MTPEEELKFKAHMRRMFFWQVVSMFPVSILLGALEADVMDTLTVCFFVTAFIFLATLETKK